MRSGIAEVSGASAGDSSRALRLDYRLKRRIPPPLPSATTLVASAKEDLSKVRGLPLGMSQFAGRQASSQCGNDLYGVRVEESGFTVQPAKVFHTKDRGYDVEISQKWTSAVL